jgi:hypothetical protein
VVEEIESVAVLSSVMNQQARDDETPLLVMTKETGKLILEMKATGDPHGERSKPASVLGWTNPTRLVVLSNLRMVLSLGCVLFSEAVLSIRLTHLTAPDERSEETSQHVAGKTAPR